MKKSFLGANTSSGFVSMYDNVLSQNKGCKLHILKGGSGSGKSTFIKEIARYCELSGLTYEEYHCSSDVGSLDGLYVPALSFAMVDGTSPHVVEPRAYAACDYIINMGEYIGSGVAQHLENINSLRQQKSERYMVAYSLIKASGQLQICADELTRLSKPSCERIATKALGEMNLSSQRKSSIERKMFLSALTSTGYISYEKELNAASTFAICGSGEAAGSQILEQVRGELTKLGYTFVTFYSALTDKYLHAIYVEELDFLLIARNILDEEVATNGRYSAIDLSAELSTRAFEVKALNTRSKEMCEAACDKMKQAAAFHAEIEKFYYPYIDFKRLNKMEQKFITKLFGGA